VAAAFSRVAWKACRRVIEGSNHGRQALAAALQRKPAIVITDVVMPEMDGYTLCKEIKSLPALKDVPVVLLTSLSGPQDIVRGLECGADGFIRKPYDDKYLVTQVEYILTNVELRKTQRLQVGIQLHFGANRTSSPPRGNRFWICSSPPTKVRSRSTKSLRAPLRHINGFAHLMEEHSSQWDPDAQLHLKRIQESTQKMGRMIDDLLNLARLDRRSMALQMTSLNSLVEIVLHDLESETADRKIDWGVGSLPSVNCDPGLIQQVFVNLLSNAVKYNRRRERAVIEIDQSTVEGELLFFVRDNGAGFDPKNSDKLFGPFQRLHTGEEFEGTGVGLATVQRIVRKHGGRIWAVADTDKGATFYFTPG
jgi:two-component system sensor histidine kinase/response regulator